MATWNHRAVDAARISRLVSNLGVSPALAALLAGLTPDDAEAERHLRPQLSQVGDPFEVGGMRAAAERLIQAIDQKERIVILGDYDVDGVTSSASLVHALRALGANPTPYVPRRMEDGYGLSLSAIERILLDGKPDLFIALDCGTNSHQEVDRLRADGIEVIIVDHHVAKDGPARDCLLVNPRVFDAADAPWQTLCTAGLVFKLIHGMLKVLRLKGDARGTALAVKDYLDLAALGTIADLVPLRQENRILTAHGLRLLSEARRPGMRALIEVSGLIPGQLLSATDVSYRLGPRINASGRLADASLPLQLLLASTAEASQAAAAELDNLNRERQEIDRHVTEEATTQLGTLGDAAALVAQGDWHPGVVGIAAGKLCRTFNRPVIVLGKEGDIAKGSGRGVPGTDLVAALQTCHELLGNYGGHPMAVGVSMPLKNLAEFRTRFAAAITTQLATTTRVENNRIEIAHWINSDDVDDRLLDELEMLQPYGEANPEPIFGITGLRLDREVQRFGEGGLNFRHTLFMSGGRRLGLIAWRMAERTPPLGKSIDFAVRLSWNRWQGRRTAQAEVVDWRLTGS